MDKSKVKSIVLLSEERRQAQKMIADLNYVIKNSKSASIVAQCGFCGENYYDVSKAHLRVFANALQTRIIAIDEAINSFAGGD